MTDFNSYKNSVFEVVASQADGHSRGTGFLIDNDGYAVTDYHVVKTSNSIKIHANNGKSYEAALIEKNAANDLALLKIDLNGDSISPLLAAAAEFKPPELLPVASIGYPSDAGESVSISFGKMLDTVLRQDFKVAEEDKEMPGEDHLRIMYELKMKTQRGFSGAPVIDAAGKVIGVVTMSDLDDRTLVTPIKHVWAAWGEHLKE